MKIKILNGLLVRHNGFDENRQSIWFLHGFGDSGLAYTQVFDSKLLHNFNLFVVDLPGFGVSPLNEEYSSIWSQSELIADLVFKEGGEKVNIVAHSLSALIGTWVCEKLKDKVNYYFNIEGNLTEADSYFSSKPLCFDTADDFANSFGQEMFEKARGEERYKRYYSSIRFASPKAMRNWGFSSQEYIKNNTCGFDFKKLDCKKFYIWGDLDTPTETQEFIKEQNLPNILYKGVGHWHMVENSEKFYGDIQNIIEQGKYSAG